REPYLRCFAVDGVFAVYTTLVPYMRQWFRIYNSNLLRQALIPDWYYGVLGLVGLGWIEKERGCRFVHLEGAMPRRAPRPLLMMRGSADTYIKPPFARELFARAREPKEFWLVEGAKHNQAFHLVTQEYQRRVLEFFEKHLA